MSSEGVGSLGQEPSASTHAPSRSPIAEGKIVADKYRVERVLGTGGMGVVVTAMHMQLGQRVALKFLHEEVCAMPDATERFLREARAAVQIQSEHVARVLDVGQLETGAPYIVMEYLDGRDLAAELQSKGQLPIDEALDYVLQAAEAIAVAHRLRIVHRDLKPANLFLSRRPDETSLVKVLDFGISKALDATGGPLGSVSMSSSMTIVGSPLYMSPEQLRTPKGVDIRTDIWSLGVILYELLTGKQPFVSDTLPQLFVQVLTEAPPSVRALRPDVPEELEQAIFRCLEKEVDQRFQQVSELANALAPFAPSAAQLCIDRIRRVTGGSIPPGNNTKRPPATPDAPAVVLLPRLPPPPALGATTPTAVTMPSVPPPAEAARIVGETFTGTAQPVPAQRAAFSLKARVVGGIAIATVLGGLVVAGSRLFGTKEHAPVAGASGMTSTAPGVASHPSAAPSAAPAEPTPASAEPAPVASETKEASSVASPSTMTSAQAAALAAKSAPLGVPLGAPMKKPASSASSAPPKPSATSGGFSDRK